MNLFNRIGDALLGKLVPGIEAKAGCGRCGMQRVKSPDCCDWGLRRWHLYDACGYCGFQCSYDCHCNFDGC